MNYYEVIDDLENSYRGPMDDHLDAMMYLMEKLGNPQDKIKTIHVAGTNGKGSVSAMIASILKEAGYRVGFFSSPHLHRYEERFCINGQMINEDEFVKRANEVSSNIEEIRLEGKRDYTVFEKLTAIAFLYFYDQEVDFAVIEVGLGGRIDSTNIIKKPLLSVITPIANDHQELLGNTLLDIAYEKAGIIKKNTIVVSAKQEDEVTDLLLETAQGRGADIIFSSKSATDVQMGLSGSHFTYNGHQYFIPLIGRYQIENALTVLAGISILRMQVKISNQAIVDGIKKVRWPGRLEKIQNSPYIVIDGAHNYHAAKALASTLGELTDKKIIGIVGIRKNKNAEGMLDELTPFFKTLIATEPLSNQSIISNKLYEMIEGRVPNTYDIRDYKEAIDKAIEIAEPDDVILVFGSFYLIGAIKEYIIQGTLSD